MPSIRKAIPIFIILVLFVSFIGLFFIYRTLPGYIEDKVRHSLLLYTPFTHFDTDVRHAGLFGLKIDNIEAGEASRSAFSIDSIDIRYSPASLFKKTIKGFDVAGLKLFLEIHDGQLSIPGLDSAVLEKNEIEPKAEINIPVNVQELRVKEGILHITVDSEQILIPFNLTLQQENSGSQSFYKSKLHLFPGSEEITFMADIDLIDNQGLVKLSSKKLPLEKLAPFLKALPELSVAGQASMNGISEIRLQPAEVVSAGIEIGLQQFNLTFNDIKVASSKESVDRKPIEVSIDYQKKKLKYQAKYIPLASPIEAIFDISGALEFSEEQLPGAGDIKVAIVKIPSLTIQDHIQLYGDVTYVYDRSSGNWHFNLKKNASSPAMNIKAQYQDILIEIGTPDYIVSGQGVAESGDVTFSTAKQQISVVQDDIKGNGSFTLDGTMQFNANGLKGRIQAELQNGRVDFTENENAIEDISLSVHLPALPKLETDASHLHFSKASFGDLSITDGRVNWQLEPSGALYLKNSVFQWAGGNLQVNDTRLTLGKKQQFITILCDQLDLIEILQQLGIKNAEGEGTVSGKIPLHLGKKSIDFENGLLSSSQGKSGRIKISAFDLLASGIPKNSPQFSQIDFAAEAMKNFKYNWVKLFLNTSGDDLVMQLQMDGSPMHPLPFTYNDNGTFSRIEAGGEGIIHPIRLDVNFRFPLNRFLGYSGKIFDIMDKIQ